MQLPARVPVLTFVPYYTSKNNNFSYVLIESFLEFFVIYLPVIGT